MAEEAIRWTGNRRAILMQLWISAEPEHLVSRLVTALEIPESVVKYHLRLLEVHGYAARRKGGQNPLPTFKDPMGPAGHGLLSAADLWRITDEGKAKAEALAAERD